MHVLSDMTFKYLLRVEYKLGIISFMQFMHYVPQSYMFHCTFLSSMHFWNPRLMHLIRITSGLLVVNIYKNLDDMHTTHQEHMLYILHTP